MLSKIEVNLLLLFLGLRLWAYLVLQLRLSVSTVFTGHLVIFIVYTLITLKLFIKLAILSGELWNNSRITASTIWLQKFSKVCLIMTIKKSSFYHTTSVEPSSFGTACAVNF